MRQELLVAAVLFYCGAFLRQIMSKNTDTIRNNTNAFLYSLSSTGTWREYLVATAVDTSVLDKWAWKCSLQCRSSKPVVLNHLRLQWKGKAIESLSASLYEKKATDQVVIPIQDNFICDGYWDTKKQQLHFDVNKKIVAVNYYSLLLSFSKVIESVVKGGSFEVIKDQSTIVLE